MFTTAQRIQKGHPVIRALVASRTSTIRSFKSSTETTEQMPEGWNEARKYSELPGPSKLAFVRSVFPGGSLHNVPAMDMQKMFLKTYGPICMIPGMLGKPDFVFLYDPSLFEGVMRTEGVWPKRIGFEAFDYYRQTLRPEAFQGMGGLLVDQGEKWHCLRTIANPAMMPPKVARSYVPTVDAISREFVAKMHTMRDASDELPATFDNELNLWALESIGTIAMDRRLGALSDERDADTDLLVKTVRQFFDLNYSVEMKPNIWKYYESKEFKRLVGVFDDMTRLVKKFIEQTVEEMDKNGSDGFEHSVLQHMLKVNRDYAILMTCDMLMAGIDTTSSVASNMLYLLATNPDKQTKLREEVMGILPQSQADLLPNDIDRMPYMKACIKETNRLHPIILGTVRATGQNLVLDNYQIPKDTTIVMIPTIAMRSDEHFPNAQQFQPERWLRSTEQQTAINPFAFLPFGFGPRACIGRRLAEMELQILIARIIRDYRVEWHHAPMEYRSTMITSPSSPLKFKLTALDR